MSASVTKYTKKAIPSALRQQVWLKRVGRKFASRCVTKWCRNEITVFNFETGHNVPESKGGRTEIDNLYPICSSCNKSMGDTYSILEWQEFGKKKKWCCI